MPVKGDSHAALTFLLWARPEGPWVLTSIWPKQDKPTTTATFEGTQQAALEAWVEERNGTQNVYWMVNPALGSLHTKAKKEHVKELQFLHVDLDPAKGKEIEVERAAIVARLEAFKPRPSAIVDSGGGFQAFWRLDEPLHIGGDPTRIADAEAYNQQLELVLGGDHCWNVDRIMRLPGTVNLPTDKKLAAGRVAAVAQVVELNDGVWPLHEFTAAPRVQSSPSPTTGVTVQIDGNLGTILIDDLPETVTQRTRMLIVQGDDPDDPTKYTSRSSAVWAVTCEMCRAGCTDDQIAMVLLDPDYGISAHVRAQRRSREYVVRQIQRAREEVEEPMLRLLNERHMVIADMGGKCRVISEVMDTSLKRPRLRISKQSFDDFRNRYMHQKVQVGKKETGEPIYKMAGHWWLGHPMRRQYTSLVFSPGREVSDAYNLWQGFACEALPGDQHQPYLDHLRKNVCSGVEANYQYLVHWMARAVQHPGEQGEVAVVMRGNRGTGKGTFINMFGSLWGRHFLQVANAKHLVGQFNAHLRDCVVLFADEAFFAGDRQHESILKTLITEDTLVVEGKGIDAEIGSNFTHLLMASNSDWVVPAGADERRFFVMDMGNDQKQNTAYFTALRRAMDNGGREALLHFLMNLDLTDFDVRAVPQTEALQDQKMFNMSVEEQWWTERLMDGRTTATAQGWQESVLKERVHGDYLRYAENQRVMRRVSPTILGKFLSRCLEGVAPSEDGRAWPTSTQRMCDVEKDDGDGRVYTVRERAYWYGMPELVRCREAWDKRFGGRFAWPAEEELPALGSPQQGDPY